MTFNWEGMYIRFCFSFQRDGEIVIRIGLTGPPALSSLWKCMVGVRMQERVQRFHRMEDEVLTQEG